MYEIVVGVNDREGPASTETPIEVFRTDPEAERRQIEKLVETREKRDQPAVDDALAAVRGAAEGEGNIMPPVLRAVQAEATLGEIMGALKEVVGAHQPTTVF